MGLLEALGLSRGKAGPAKQGGGGNTAAPPGTTGGTGGGTTGTAPSTAPPDPKRILFETARVAAERLSRALAGHAQRAQVQAQLTTAQAQYASADAHAAAGRWTQAMQALADAKQRFERAQAAADLWVDYQARRTSLRTAAISMSGYWNDAAVAALTTALKTAQLQAAANPPNLAGAIKTLTDAEKVVHTSLKSSVDALKAELAKVTGSATATVQAFASAEIAQAQTVLATADAALASGNWGQVAQSLMVVTFSIPALQRFAGRRATYEAERTPIAAQLAQLQAQPALATRLGALDALLLQADAEASHDNMQFERGSALLKDLKARCDAWQAVAAQAADLDRQRPLAEQACATLDAHAAAPAVAAERAAARTLLQQADTAARAGAAAADPGNDLRQALALVVRVRADLQTAQARADGMGPVLEAQQAAAKPGNTAGLKKQVEALGKAYDATAATSQAGASTTLVQQGRAQLAEATQALAGKNGALAARALGQAADTLAAARALQAQQAQAEAQVPALRARLATLQSSPRATAIKVRIDALVAAIAGIDAAIASHDAAAALAAIVEAGNVATAAEQADTDRDRYDQAVAPLRAQVNGVADKADKKRLQGLLVAVDAHADALRFPEADAARRKLLVDIDKAALDRAKKKKPPVAKDLHDLAARMASNGGGAEVDAMIQDPKTTDPAVLAAMTGGRFGIVLRAHASGSGQTAKRAGNIKALASTFAKVPEHVAARGSITEVDAFHSENRSGGAWGPDGTVELTGRPKQQDQTYGSGMTSPDQNGNPVSQLPASIDPDCQAAPGAKTDLLSFTALHEVGHGVDDSLTYMARNGAKPDHGGWKEYGTGLQEVADAVGPHIAAQVSGSNFYSTPEQKAYVMNRLMTKPAPRPAGLVAGSAEERAYDAFEAWFALATSDGIWERDGDAMSIAIDGRVYHEAYKRNWVSYLSAARSKGLTGYQFRSPAEWFAELYAGFHSGVLGPNHPSRAWLAKL